MNFDSYGALRRGRIGTIPQEDIMLAQNKVANCSAMQTRVAPMAFFIVVATGLAASSAELKPAVAAWPTFQNAGRLIGDIGALPLEWSPDANLAWQVAIEGYGQSAPVIRSNLVVVTSTSGPNKEKCHLAAFQLTSGKKRWQRDFDNPSPQENNSYVSKAAPTPVADANGFIAFYEGGLIVAVDQTGETRWSRNLVEDYGPIAARHGLASSLEQNDRQVFVWVERGETPYLLALDKKTGKTTWKADGLAATTWSSPRLVPTADGDHLVCSASGKLAGFEPATGKLLWEFSEIANNTSCTPIPLGAGRFLIGASDGRGEHTGGQGAASNGVVQIARQSDGAFAAKFVWQAKKASSSFGSPVVAGDKAFFVNRAGVLFQLDLQTGKEQSTTRVASGSIWATPLVAGEHLYLFGYKGTTSVLSLADGKEVATNQLWEASAEAAADGRPSTGGHVLYAASAAPPYLILRRGDVLYAVVAREPQSQR